MVEQAPDDANQYKAKDVAANMAEIAARSQRVIRAFLTRHSAEAGMADPTNVGKAFIELTTRMMADPAKLAQAQMSLWQDYMALWQHTGRRMMGDESEPMVEPASDDRRFRHAGWDDNHLFDFIKQSYLLTARGMQATVRDVEGLDDHETPL